MDGEESVNFWVQLIQYQNSLRRVSSVPQEKD